MATVVAGLTSAALLQTNPRAQGFLRDAAEYGLHTVPFGTPWGALYGPFGLGGRRPAMMQGVPAEPDGRRRAVSGWGYAGAGLVEAEVASVAAVVHERFGIALERREPVLTNQVALPPPRLRPPAALAAIASSDVEDRCLHAVGRSFLDMVRAFEGNFTPAPDLVLRPRDEAELTAALEWCAEAGAAVIPFGGGTSVVGGVQPPGEGPAVTLQLRALDRVLEIDHESRAARIQAGAVGPVIEDQLRPSGLTMRFYPQSFEFSTLGGWIATRAGGHYATRLTHIDDLVESVAALTPAGRWESRRLPGSGAGPSPDRMLLGSEGTLGVITEAWVRLQQRPRWRVSASVRFPGFLAGAAALRALVQSGLDPANCRLLDPQEAALFGGGDGVQAVLVLGFESAHHPVDTAGALALELLRDHGGDCPEGLRHREERADDGDDPAATWRSSFLRAPYLRDAMVALGMISETFETAITWDRWPDFDAFVRERAMRALNEIFGGGTLNCRFTHVYTDGPAPYYTFAGAYRAGDAAEQARQIKAAVSDAVMAAGGTITHHHAVGRQHRPWYDIERPELFADALRAVKRELDPNGVLNPGVLIDP